MFVFISGAARSGKSNWAERCAARLDGGPKGSKIYLATARVPDQEMRRRVALHQSARRGRGFATLECITNLQSVVPLISGATVLLECLGTWTANELFDDRGRMADPDGAFEKIRSTCRLLRESAAHLLIVSNDIFSDGTAYAGETEEYRRVLGTLHICLAAESDMAVECAAGFAAVHKGKKYASMLDRNA
ncbi:MAG: bifunctional adenosylcobinamide kinase/adenosylcobinamide-phosphate guanylyltransferase [Synergistaceae bacterium]|jgi:adenosylcobinamide kinase/adenosylcobinamide-phosphate guanylyltransferase|nr:bifunctional adenosylcobinamide kinase/adenosylcobinamide-phosphate guanylyltransferase [Synergistaceae bacterium]